MRVSELEVGPVCDSLVALAQDWALIESYDDSRFDYWEFDDGYCDVKEYTPSQGNQQTYEVAQKFKLRVDFKHHTAAYCRWDELTPDYWTEYGGKTTALAVCKAVIASEWGDTIPDDVMEQVR